MQRSMQERMSMDASSRRHDGHVHRVRQHLCLAVSFLLLLLLHSPATAQSGGSDKNHPSFTYSVRPSFTGSMNTDNRKSRETMLYMTYGQWRSNVGFDLWEFRVKSYLNADFRRQMYSDAPPKTLQDLLIVSFIPSMVVFPEQDISLFLEATMETQMAHGERDGYPTAFMDPAYFYETLYLGQWIEWRSDDRSARLSMRYGIGYAFQQTRSVHFILTEERTLSVDPDNPLYEVKKAKNTKLESGYSTLFGAEYQNKFTEQLVFGFETMGVMQMKGGPINFTGEPRLVGEFGTYLRYTFFTFKYDIRVVYDPNVSTRRVLNQSASLGFMYEFND
jgi:hypothetical protein